ncbi:hypothetical protein NC652_009128 [Populus alba x Populus x berolinensis]|nr:hypothetical protein NC652_009128 [Populus alba x Populus x berolinensis]
MTRALGAPSPLPLLLFHNSLTALSSFFRVSLFPLTLRLLFFIPLSAGASKIPKKPLSFDPSARFPPSILLNLFKSRVYFSDPRSQVYCSLRLVLGLEITLGLAIT